MDRKLKCPFPYFGGKSRVAPIVWNRLGNVDNFIEPFCGSAAMLLLRPSPPRIETLNDADCMVANFWRATAASPDLVAEWADWPVNEADLHARHRWLVLSPHAREFRRRMRTEPGFYDAQFAGWWCWGLCCWIGGGWCTEPAESDGEVHNRRCKLTGGAPGSGALGTGVHANGPTKESAGRKPRIDGGNGQYGHGIHAGGQLPMLTGDSGASGRGVHAKGQSQQIPLIGDPPRGVHRGADGNRPQLADAYSRGRGIHGNDDAGTCAQRLLWLRDWFGRLRDRLRTVRVCCGDWLRVCDSESVTTRLGTTGVFFDPPYGHAADRDMNLYAVESGTVAADVLAYCLERGSNPKMRIALAGYAGEGHEVLEKQGWDVVAWEAQGGYGNRSKKGQANAKKERLWFSPNCLREASLYDLAETEG